MKVAKYAMKRMEEEDRSGNDQLVMYWRAYIDGCIAQKKEDVEAFKTLCSDKDKLMEILRQHCDSHIEMCEECGMREIIESVPSAWISVKDRLPEESGYYIVYSPYLKVWFVRWSSVFKAWNCGDESDENRLDDITHWMPLPSAPEVDE